MDESLVKVEETWPFVKKEDEDNYTSNSDMTEDENVPKTSTTSVIEVKCGHLYAKMHLQHFLCPGIHQPCIELEGKMISPKEFTIQANKDKQKDWKGSIRIGKSNLRTLMEMRTLDFHNHQAFCSAKCQSRNYITPKEKDPEKDGRRLSNASFKNGQFTALFQGPNVPQQSSGSFGVLNEESLSKLMQLSGVYSNNNNGTSTTSPTEVQIKKEEPGEDEIIDVDDSMSSSKSNSPSHPPVSETAISQMTNDPCNFWSQMKHKGLVDNVIETMMDTLSDLKSQIVSGDMTNAAPLLSRTIASLGACDKVVSLIRRRDSLTNLHIKHRLSTDYSTVEDISHRKRSIDEASCASVEATDVIKRPRVQYAIPFATTTTQPPPSVPTELLDSSVMAALMHAQLHQLQPAPPMELLMKWASIAQAPHQSDSLLAIK